MKDFNKFLQANKDLLYSVAEKNTPRNSDGHAVIKKDDPWFDDNSWDTYYEELIFIERNSSAGSMVR